MKFEIFSITLLYYICFTLKWKIKLFVPQKLYFIYCIKVNPRQNKTADLRYEILRDSPGTWVWSSQSSMITSLLCSAIRDIEFHNFSFFPKKVLRYFWPWVRVIILPFDGIMTHFHRYWSDRRVWDNSKDAKKPCKLWGLKINSDSFPVEVDKLIINLAVTVLVKFARSICRSGERGAAF